MMVPEPNVPPQGTHCIYTMILGRLDGFHDVIFEQDYYRPEPVRSRSRAGRTRYAEPLRR
jgi:hypothetical protein